MKDWKEVVQKIGPLRIGIMALCGVLLLVLTCGGSFFDSGEKIEVTEDSIKEEQVLNEKDKMKMELEELLSHVEGIGTVHVMMTMKQEKEELSFSEKEENVGMVEGVVVVCSGAENSLVQQEIIEAIGALFHLDSHKIKIMKSKEAKE